MSMLPLRAAEAPWQCYTPKEQISRTLDSSATPPTYVKVYLLALIVLKGENLWK